MYENPGEEATATLPPAADAHDHNGTLHLFSLRTNNALQLHLLHNLYAYSVHISPL